MSGMKSLAKETAIYGVSSILGKTLNWLLTPLFTYTFTSTAEYGVITNLYAYIALAIVILTFGMETGLFRFANKKDEHDSLTVYSTTLIAVGSVVLVFFALAMVFLKPITYLIGSSIPQEYVLLIIIVLCMDSFSAIPFAYLRYKKRPVKFASLKMLFILLYIILCFFFLLACPAIYKSHPDLISWFYMPGKEVLYVLIANVLATFIQTCCLIPELTGFKYRFDTALLKKMLNYSMPLLILGIAGTLNQTADKIIFPYIYPEGGDALAQLGIYGACFKIAVVMVMFTQAFRYAYEPFIFAKNTGNDNKQSYALAMKFFIIFGLFIFLGVMFYMDLIKYFIKSTYFEGLQVVPIVMMGELFFGIYFNLSLWYKLTDQTHWGAIFSVAGCIIIISLNIFLIPVYGYMACAWASFIGNFIIMVISYIMGQKKFPINYDLKSIGLYFCAALLLYVAAITVPIENIGLKLLFRTTLLFAYIYLLIKRDLPLKEIPYLKRFSK